MTTSTEHHHKKKIIGEGTTSHIRLTTNPRYVQKILKTDIPVYRDLLRSEFENYLHFYKHCKPLKKFLIEITEYNPVELSFTMSNLLYLGYTNLYQYDTFATLIQDAQKINICNQMIDFLKLLHYEARYTHSDIKPNNIFIHVGRIRVKFIDFGFSKQYLPTEHYNPLGTVLFSSPEMIGGIIQKKKLQGDFFYKNDWWGLGMTILFLLYNDEYNNYKKYMNVLINRFKEKPKKINLRRNMERYRVRFDQLLFPIFSIHFFE